MLSEEAQFQNGVGISSKVNAPTKHTENMLAIRTVNSAEKQSFKESFLQNVPSIRSESDSTEMSFACDTFHMKEFGPIKDTNASQIVQEQESVDICSDLKKVEDELGEPNEVSIRFNRSGMEKSHLMSKFAEEQITEQAEILVSSREHRVNILLGYCKMEASFKLVLIIVRKLQEKSCESLLQKLKTTGINWL